MTPDNTDVFMRSEVPETNHMFWSEGNEFSFIYRANLANFDAVADFAEQNGFRVHREQYPRDNTYKHFTGRFGRTSQAARSARAHTASGAQDPVC